MKYDINKLRGSGLRYLAVDRSGQMWAFEKMPVRMDGYWRIADEFMPPAEVGEEYREHYKKAMRWRWNGRQICVPVYDAPFSINWEDEPLDLVKNGTVKPKDMKVWGSF